MRVAIASFAGMPPEFNDDQLLVAALRERGADAAAIPWDDPDADWEGFEAVIIRSTWDYARRRERFLEWVDAIGPRLHNAPALVRWNTDKRYLGDLAAAGLPVVETLYLEPGSDASALEGEIVVKPSVSAGGRDTGRFAEAAHDEARALIERIHESGRTAMVQPFNPNVDELGETAVLMIDGEPAHALRKLAVLRPDEVAPVRDDGVGAAETMYDPGLVGPARAAEDELDLAARVVAEIAERFSYLPLYARVDMLRDPDGSPVLLELEAIEPNFYLEQVPATAERVAEAIIARA